MLEVLRKAIVANRYDCKEDVFTIGVKMSCLFLSAEQHTDLVNRPNGLQTTIKDPFGTVFGLVAESQLNLTVKYKSKHITFACHQK